MASIGFLIRGAIIKVIAFSESNFLFSTLSKEPIDEERPRHDKAIEDMQLKLGIRTLRIQLTLSKPRRGGGIGPLRLFLLNSKTAGTSLTLTSHL